MKRTWNRIGIPIVLLLSAFLAAPAAAGDSDSWRAPWPFGKNDKPGKPDKIIAIWSDTVMTRAGQAPLRGFGGRLLFYENKKEDPVKIDGTLVVYAFDDTGRDAEHAKPDRKYVYLPEQLPAHYSKSKVGHSYSFWLPWDEVGGLQKEITLIVRFEPKDSPAVLSEPCKQVLPGALPPSGSAGAAPPMLPANLSTAACPVAQAGGNQSQPVGIQGASAWPTDQGVQQVSYNAALPQSGPNDWDADGRPRRMTTTTIAMSPEMALRQRLAGPQQPPPQQPLNPQQPSAGNYRPPTGNWQPPAGNYQPPAGNWQPPGPWMNPVTTQNVPASHFTEPRSPSNAAMLNNGLPRTAGVMEATRAASPPAMVPREPGRAYPMNPAPMNSMNPSNLPPRQADSRLDPPQAGGAPLGPPNRDHAPWQPYPGGSPSAPATQPAPAYSNGWQANSPAAGTLPY